MEDKNFLLALNFLFPSEGGYSNHKYDKGGATNMGVTQSTYNSYRKKRGQPPKNVREITKDEAIKIYYENYWLPSGAHKMNTKMGIAVFDTAVLHGVGGALKFFRNCGGNLNRFLALRLQSYEDIIEKDRTQRVFYKGWQNRVQNLIKYLEKITP